MFLLVLWLWATKSSWKWVKVEKNILLITARKLAIFYPLSNIYLYASSSIFPGSWCPFRIIVTTIMQRIPGMVWSVQLGVEPDKTSALQLCWQLNLPLALLVAAIHCWVMPSYHNWQVMYHLSCIWVLLLKLYTSTIKLNFVRFGHFVGPNG